MRINMYKWPAAGASINGAGIQFEVNANPSARIKHVMAVHVFHLNATLSTCNYAQIQFHSRFRAHHELHADRYYGRN